MRTKNIKKLIYRDCGKSMASAVLFYSLGDILGGLLTVYTAGVLGEFADGVLGLDFSYGLQNFWKLLAAVGISVLVVPLIGMLGEVTQFVNALKHERMVLGRFLDKTYESILKIEEGEVQYYLDGDMISLRCEWVIIWNKVLTIPLVLGFLLCNALQISPMFTLIVFAISLFKLTVPMAVKKLQARYDRQQREYQTRVRAMEAEITGKPETVRLLGLSRAFIGRLDGLYREYYKNVFMKSVKCNKAAEHILAFLDTFCILAILFVGAVMVSRQQISTGAVAAMVGYFSIINDMVRDTDRMIRKIPILQNLADRIRVLYEDAEASGSREVGDIRQVMAEGLSFAYGEQEVLRNLDFTMEAGRKTIIYGANGSGKSTLIKLLCGLLKNYKGSLKINGCELKEADMGSLRKNLSYVPQEPYLFEGTVRENICLGNLAAREAAVDAVMQRLEIEYLADRKVSAKQNDLSGGEKQRISLARALLRDAPVLILDEPGNHLDADTVEWLQGFIKETEKTVLYISHDSTLRSLADVQISL